MDVRDVGVVVTGAGRGLGEALAEELAAAGARVVLVARHEGEIGAVAQRIRARGGVAHAIAADVADKRAVHKIAGASAALAGPIDLLVNNASTLGVVPLRSLLDTECEAFDAALAANLVGPFRLTKAIAGSMVLRRRGLVVNVSSDAAVSAYASWGAYGVSKAALEHLGRIWGAELEGTGVRVVSVDPGEMRTRMHADALPGADPATLLEPRVVARRILAVVRGASALPNGARVEAAQWSDA